LTTGGGVLALTTGFPNEEIDMSAGFKQWGADPDIVEGRVMVASFDTYQEAEAAVDYLADKDFPVERVAIVGQGVKLVEQVTGRVGYLDAALRAGFGGAVAGALIGWLFGVFNWVDPLVAAGWLALDGLWFGFVVGALMGLLAHALTHGRRDFTSVGRLAADRFDLVVDESVAEEAMRLLDELSPPTAREPAAAQPNGSSRPAGPRV
jgi:heat induced stress protein YflT